MKYEIEVPEYTPSGIKTIWEDGFEIEVDISKNSACIKANSAGLISLARHCLTLAQKNVPAGHHIHYDDYNSLEEGSSELIILKMQFGSD